jgi:hypothetical protein
MYDMLSLGTYMKILKAETPKPKMVDTNASSRLLQSALTATKPAQESHSNDMMQTSIVIRDDSNTKPSLPIGALKSSRGSLNPPTPMPLLSTTGLKTRRDRDGSSNIHRNAAEDEQSNNRGRKIQKSMNIINVVHNCYGSNGCIHSLAQSHTGQKFAVSKPYQGSSFSQPLQPNSGSAAYGEMQRIAQVTFCINT